MAQAQERLQACAQAKAAADKALFEATASVDDARMMAQDARLMAAEAKRAVARAEAEGRTFVARHRDSFAPSRVFSAMLMTMATLTSPTKSTGGAVPAVQAAARRQAEGRCKASCGNEAAKRNRVVWMMQIEAASPWDRKR